MKRREVLRAAVAVTGVGLAAAGCGDAGPATWHPAPHAGTSSSPSPSPLPGGALPSEITRGPVNRAAIALTFHGQGDPRLATQLLAELATGGAHVTVMAVGTWLQAQPTMARKILDGGHELGNHTQHHVAIAQMAAAAAFTEIDECAQTLRRITGTAGRWFRPSQTQHATATIKAEARRAGYPTCLSYDVDSLDYTDPPPATVVHNVLSQVANGSIVSMHFGHATTIAAIGPLLDGVRSRGLTTATMSQLVDA